MALMWLIPFSRRISLPFWTSHAFILLPKRQNWYDSHLLPWMCNSIRLFHRSSGLELKVCFGCFFFFFLTLFCLCIFPLTYPLPSPICNSDSLLPQNRAFKWIRLANNFCEVAFSNGVITQWCTNVVFALLVGKQRSG